MRAKALVLAAGLSLAASGGMAQQQELTVPPPEQSSLQDELGPTVLPALLALIAIGIFASGAGGS